MEKLGEKSQFAGRLPLVSDGMVVSAQNILSEPVDSFKESVVCGHLVVKADSPQKAGDWRKNALAFKMKVILK